MQAEIIAIGDELITGQRLDTNTKWLSERLFELGIPVAFHTTVGDCLEDNVHALQGAIRRADVVVLTGGLGPTADDLTRVAVAEATGTELIRDAQEVRRIRAFFANRGREMPESNLVQADLPRGATVIPNPDGTAPGIAMRLQRSGPSVVLLFALPGVPAEMFAMWSATVGPALRAAQPVQKTIKHYRILCFGVGESQLEGMLPDLIRRGREPTVGITVSDALITLRVTAMGQDDADCLRAMEPTLGTIRETLGSLIFGEEGEQLEEVVVRLLEEGRQQVAVAEWGTGGLVSQKLIAADRNACTWAGGCVFTRLDQFSPWFHPTPLPANLEPDSRELAVYLAESVRERTQADYGLGIAALPSLADAGTGRLHVALATQEWTRHFHFSTASHPAIRQNRSTLQALNVLRLTLSGHST